ncbi:tRNA (N(6)-L-threonylcarbamoyladenosine(37)-C(2))-methylthiotransferase MtaB, partial [Pseudomonas sp. FW305-130]
PGFAEVRFPLPPVRPEPVEGQASPQAAFSLESGASTSSARSVEGAARAPGSISTIHILATDGKTLTGIPA